MRILIGALHAAVLVLVAGCGGGGGGDGASAATVPIFSAGAVTAIGSVVVNGIRFEDTAADIAGDDTPKTLADIRKIGVMLRIRGRLIGDGRSGIADRIEIENELRGPIASITPPDAFTVLGQSVLVDGSTVFEDTTGLGGADPLAVSDVVEVHGDRDASGFVHATRVERMAGPGVDELRGVIAAKSGTTSGTLTIGGADFTYDAATEIVPAGAAFGVGTPVEIHLTGTLITRLEVEELDEPGLEPGEGSEARIEGFISGFTEVASPFFVGGQAVDASNARFIGGVAADLANDFKVEAEGRIVGGVLVANEIEFLDPVRMRSVVQGGSVPAGGTGQIVMFGATILVTAATLNGAGAIDAGDPLELRAYMNADGQTLTATRIESMGPIDADKHELQGVAVSKNPMTMHLTILGIDVDAGGWNGAGAGVQFEGFDEAPMTPTACFAAIIEGATVVRVRGTPGAGTLTANEVELE